LLFGQFREQTLGERSAQAIPAVFEMPLQTLLFSGGAGHLMLLVPVPVHRSSRHDGCHEFRSKQRRPERSVQAVAGDLWELD
jgi:hypothetical protein